MSFDEPLLDANNLQVYNTNGDLNLQQTGHQQQQQYLTDPNGLQANYLNNLPDNNGINNFLLNQPSGNYDLDLIAGMSTNLTTDKNVSGNDDFGINTNLENQSENNVELKDSKKANGKETKKGNTRKRKKADADVDNDEVEKPEKEKKKNKSTNQRRNIK